MLLQNAIRYAGRFPELAGGRAVLFRTNPRTGQVRAYHVYDAGGLPVKRVDLAGVAHGGVSTPHGVEFVEHVNSTGIVFRPPTRTVRSARAEEIP